MKIVDFGLSENSKEGNLYTQWDDKDVKNGPGEYLGIIDVGTHHLLVTRNLDDNTIKVNEIEYDFDEEKGFIFFYRAFKTDECNYLESKLNKSEIRKKIISGVSLDALLQKELTSELENKFISSFTKEKEDELMYLFGIKPKVFADLRNSNIENGNFLLYEKNNIHDGKRI